MIKHLFPVLLLLTATNLSAQVSVNQDNSAPDPSAMLDVKSTDKGILIPRMNAAQRSGINDPADGLLVFDNSTNSFWYFNGAGWIELTTGTDNQTLDLSGTTLSISNGNNVSLAGINTDNQTLGLSGATLSISNGNNVSLTGINTDNQTLSLSGTTLNIAGGNSIDLAGLKDNLGNHTATQNVKLNGHYLSGDGGSEGVFVDADGNVGINRLDPRYVFHPTRLTSAISDGLVISRPQINAMFHSTNIAYGETAGIGFATGGPNLLGAAIVHQRTAASSVGKLYFATKRDGTLAGEDIPISMTIDQFGNVGIGTTNPQVALHVVGVPATANGEGNYFNYTFPPNGPTQEIQSVTNVVGYFEGDVVANQSIVSMYVSSWSDARAKHILRRSDSREDLDLLKQIKITDYQWVDRVEDHGRVHKKVIAQEVEQVLPDAVSRMRKPIPNVYANAVKLDYDPATKVLTVYLDKAHDFSTGDKAKLFTDRGDLEETEVLSVPSPQSFTVSCETEPSRAFVYGKWVDDYRKVDYDAIAMLNVSATQELAKEIAALQKRNAELEALLDAKTSAMQTAFEQRFQQMEASLRQLTNAAGTSRLPNEK